MKGIVWHILSGLFLTLLISGCAKGPHGEIEAARSAVDAAISEGAEQFAPAEAMKVNGELAAAMREVHSQDGKFLKDYGKAKQMLAAVKTDADALRAGLDAKKADARKKALSALEEAESQVDGARTALAGTSGDKLGKEADEINDEVNGFGESLAEVRRLIATEDYPAAVGKAEALQSKAGEVGRGIRALKDKPGPETAGRKKYRPRAAS